MDLNILYEDNHIIVCYKPRGILSQADGSNASDMLTILKQYIKEKYNKPGDVYLGLVHRLDRNTDGVMVFARTSKAASRLSDDIKNDRFHKKYLAVVEGRVLGSLELRDMLYYDEAKKKAFIKRAQGSKEAILTYSAIDYKNDKTLLDISLKTGRHHQIRCQLSNIGHPIVGDIKYGSSIRLGDRYLLSAYSLTIIHPTKKEEMVFEYIPEGDYKEFNIK
ncbi:MAG: RNA pseudouridine synthase [Acholeplasmatales bacterium]|nr:RNA pseudouridine synthase [Acholeplasmatales bacterium]